MQLNELEIFGSVRRAFELIHTEVRSRIPKIDRMSTGMMMLNDCAKAVQLIRKINVSRDKQQRAEMFTELKSILYDIDSVLVLYRESQIISVAHHAEIAECLAKTLEQFDKWSKH